MTINDDVLQLESRNRFLHFDLYYSLRTGRERHDHAHLLERWNQSTKLIRGKRSQG